MAFAPGLAVPIGLGVGVLPYEGLGGAKPTLGLLNGFVMSTGVMLDLDLKGAPIEIFGGFILPFRAAVAGELVLTVFEKFNGMAFN